MHKKITYEWLADKCICILLILSMLSVVNLEIAGFPVYSLLLLVLTSVWMICKIIYAGKMGFPVLSVKYPTDTAAMAVIAYAFFFTVIKLFDRPIEGGIDFTWNAEAIALAIVYLLISSGTEFKLLYLDLLIYSGLPVTGLYLLANLTDGWENSRLAVAFADSGQIASYFLLIGIVSVYGYCMCRDRVRSVFYIMVSGIIFFALLLNRNVISLWLLGIFFLAIPVMFRPTAMLVKRVMQLFFVYIFMASNMCLLTEYTQNVRTEVRYSLEYGIYLDLLLAAGGIVFFHYWDRIPEGVDLERLVLRKMQKGYCFLLKAALLIFVVIVFDGDGWETLPDGMISDIAKSFVLPLAEMSGKYESGFLDCIKRMGLLSGIILLVSIILLLDKVYKNYAQDKPVTDILILISGIFVVQLLFWNLGMHNIVCYFYLLVEAAFYKEERKMMASVGVRISDLELKIQEIK